MNQEETVNQKQKEEEERVLDILKKDEYKSLRNQLENNPNNPLNEENTKLWQQFIREVVPESGRRHERTGGPITVPIGKWLEELQNVPKEPQTVAGQKIKRVLVGIIKEKYGLTPEQVENLKEKIRQDPTPIEVIPHD
ncbi:MAG: hypothetical protein ACKO3R_05990 [bacterium]